MNSCRKFGYISGEGLVRLQVSESIIFGDGEVKIVHFYTNLMNNNSIVARIAADDRGCDDDPRLA